jgi:cytochrome P450
MKTLPDDDLGIGRNLAWLELKLAMATLLWRFDLEQRFPDDWADQKAHIVWDKPPLFVRLRPVRARQ